MGDEVVISWPPEKGLAGSAGVQCFFAMVDLLESRRAQYEALYGVVPRFRAGLHGGPVFATWVGLAKTELGFFGDTLNATSRIQGLCKVHDEPCIVSGAILERSPLPNGSSARSLGIVELRGKSETMELYAITCPAGTSPESG